MNVIRAPAIGDVVSGAADVGGWRHDAGVGAYPSSTIKAADGWARASGVAVPRDWRRATPGCALPDSPPRTTASTRSRARTAPRTCAPPHTHPPPLTPDNCMFGVDMTLALAPSGATVDAVWATAGDECVVLAPAHLASCRVAHLQAAR